MLRKTTNSVYSKVGELQDLLGGAVSQALQHGPPMVIGCVAGHRWICLRHPLGL